MDELLKKMYYKQGVITVLNSPPEFEDVLCGWKAETTIARGESAASLPQGSAAPEFLLVFTPDAESVKSTIPPLIPRLGKRTVFWIAFPKQTSRRYDSDINRDRLWALVEPPGLRPNRNVAIDEDWSALRFVAAEAGA